MIVATRNPAARRREPQPVLTVTVKDSGLKGADFLLKLITSLPPPQQVRGLTDYASEVIMTPEACAREGRWEMEVPRRERLEEFFRRLHAAPSAGTFDEALAQLTNVLDGVEDELTSIPNDPGSWQSDQRIYPPQQDAVREVPAHPRVKRFRSRHHNTYIGENGSVEIVTLSGRVEVQKPGLDGRGVWELD
ncbi:MAG TPA: hypothetical protein VF006_11050 [Longimicrobium sp.]